MRLEGLLASVTTQGNTICRQPSVWLWTANRTAESRACSHVGCGGTMETKFQHIGQCRKPSMAQMRARFAAKYGIPTTGGTFLDRQVIEIMAHDSSGWGVALNREQTEAAVHEYLGELHLDRFGSRS
jgi:hypothetical protein